MTQALEEAQTINIDTAHWCNACANRDFDRLEAVEVSPHARHLCGLDPDNYKVVAFRNGQGAVYACSHHAAKRGAL